MPALALLLPRLTLGALLPQLPELLRVVEEAGNAFLAHTDVLTLMLPCQGRSEVPVVVLQHFPHPRERRFKTLSPERAAIEVDGVIARVVHESFATAHRKVGNITPCVIGSKVGNRHAPLGRLGHQRLAAVHLARHVFAATVEVV